MKQITLAAAIAFTGACGGGGDYREVPLDPDSAALSVESMNEVFAAMSSSDSAGAADAVLALTAAGQILVSPNGAREVPAQAYLPLEWRRSKTRVPYVTGTAECNASGCVFVDYGDDSEYGSFRINGRISRTGDTLVFDLTYDVLSEGFDFTWRMYGDLMVTPTLVDGEVHSDGDAKFVAEGKTYNIDWDIDIGYNNIGLVDGCAVSGSLDARVAMSASGASGSGSYRAAGSISFGPACGQYSSN